MIEIQKIIDSARSYVKTPFLHQGRLPGVGLDCIGMIRQAALDNGIITSEVDHINYSMYPDPKDMEYHLSKHMTKVAPTPKPEELLPGDVIWMSFHNEPTHVAIYTEKDTIIHAISAGPKAVVENSWSPDWQKRMVAVYRFKEPI